jgi:Ni,Fe-hydrogenase III component G
MEKLEEQIMKAIKERYETIIEEETRQAVAQATATIERRINALADSLALSIIQHYDIQRHGDNILITVRKTETQ